MANFSPAACLAYLLARVLVQPAVVDHAHTEVQPALVRHGIALEFLVLFEVRTRLAGQVGAHVRVVQGRIGGEIPSRSETSSRRGSETSRRRRIHSGLPVLFAMPGATRLTRSRSAFVSVVIDISNTHGRQSRFSRFCLRELCACALSR